MKYIKLNTPATTVIQYKQVIIITKTVHPVPHWSTLIQSVESYDRVYPELHSPQALPTL